MQLSQTTTGSGVAQGVFSPIQPQGAFLRLTVESDDLATRDTLRRVLDHFALDADAAGVTEIVLAEVLNNIVEHAYGEEGSGPIEIECVKDFSRLDISVVDYGREMPGRQTPMGTAVALDLPRGDLPEGGFGWSLIHALTEGLEYQRNGEQNQLTLSIPLNSTPRAN